jgi:hypothetical protein
LRNKQKQGDKEIPEELKKEMPSEAQEKNENLGRSLKTP